MKQVIFILVIVPIILVSSCVSNAPGGLNQTANGLNNTKPPQTPPASYCGEGVCNNGENCSSCPRDCGACVTTISITQLTTFVENTINKNFPNIHATVYKFSDIQDEISKGYGCFTGFNPPCSMWTYQNNAFFVDIFDFGEGNSPSIDTTYNVQMNFGGVTRATLSNGEIIEQSYGLPVYSSYFVAVKIPCKNQYWIEIMNSDYNNSIDIGLYRQSANEILNYCK